MKSFSLHNRTTWLTLSLSLVLIAVIGGFSVFTLIQLHQAGRNTALGLLMVGVENALAASGGDAEPDAIRRLYEANQPSGEFMLRVWQENGEATPMVEIGFTDLPWSRLRPLIWENQPDIGDDFISKREIEIKGDGFDFFWRRLQLGAANVNILIVHSDRGVRSQLAITLVRFAIFIALTSLGAIVAAFFLVRTTMAPIRAIGRQCEGIDQGAMHPIHLPSEDLPVELEPLVHALNGMLARLEVVMAKQRQFVADASHELRTPLATAKSSLQLALSRERSRDEYKASMSSVLDDLERIARLCEQLIRLARLDSDHQRIDFEELELIEPLRDAIQAVTVNPHHDQPQILLLDYQPIRVVGNRDLLARLFQNLIDNAVKYGPPERPVSVQLSYRQSQVIVQVIDEGGTIPAESLPRLFDRFYRDDASRNRASGGSGLGLAIALELAHLHGAELSIVSSPDQGTVVSFSMLGKRES